MVSLPPNTPKEILAYCSTSQSNEDAVNTLKNNTKLFIQFFDEVCKDEGWVKKNEDLANRMASHLNNLSQEGKLDLTETRSVRSAAQLAAQRFQSPNLKALSTEFVDEDLTILVEGKPIKINHSLFAAASPMFQRMIKGGFKEATLKEFPIPEIDLKTMTALKEFIETGSTQTNLDPKAVMNVMFACEKLLFPKLADQLSEKYLTMENLMELVELAHRNNWPGVRDQCFKFIEKNFEGFKITAQGFNDLHIEMEGNADLRELTPFLEFYNPDKKDPNVTKDFHLSLKIGTHVFPAKMVETQKAADGIFRLLPFARSVDLSEAAPLGDGILFALGMHCPKLEGLNLKGGKFVTDKGMEFLISKCPHVKSLDLQGCRGLTNATLERIAKAYHSNLLELDVEGCVKIDETGLIAVANFCTNLRKLGIGKNGLITSEFYLAMSNKLVKIEQLKVTKNADAAHLSADELTTSGLLILSMPSLKKLAIDDLFLTNEFLKLIAKHHKDIQELQFFIHPLRNWNLQEGFTAIAKECKNLTALEFLDVLKMYGNIIEHHNFQFKKEDVSALISNNPQLQRLKLGASIEEEHVRLLAETCPSLTAISLIGSASEEALLELSEKCPNVELFELGWNYVLSNNGLAQMVNNWAKLRSLYLVICPHITAEAIAYTIQTRPLESLGLMPGEASTEIEYGETNPHPFFTTKTLEMLPACCPKLKKLFINRRMDLADSNPALAAIAQQCHHLEEIYLHLNNMNPGSIHLLLKNNPKLSVMGLQSSPGPQSQPRQAPLIRDLDKKLLEEHPTLEELMINEPYNVSDLVTDDAQGLQNVTIELTGGS